MAINYGDLFNGASLGAAWTSAHTGGGSHTVSGGLLNVAVTAANGVARLRLTGPYNWDDGERVVVEISAFPSQGRRLGFGILNNVSGTFFPAVFFNMDNDRTYAGNLSKADGTFGTTALAPIATYPFLALRRTGTSIVYECSTDGSTWTTILTEATGSSFWDSSIFSGCYVELCFQQDNSLATTAAFASFNPSAGGGGGSSLAAVLRRRREL